jgi:hypothetical protein
MSTVTQAIDLFVVSESTIFLEQTRAVTVTNNNSIVTGHCAAAGYPKLCASNNINYRSNNREIPYWYLCEQISACSEYLAMALSR